MSTLQALQLSRKGGHVYDSGWYKDGRVYETLVNCMSSPKISSEIAPPVLQNCSSTLKENDEQHPPDISEGSYIGIEDCGNVEEEGSFSNNASSSTLLYSTRDIKLDDIQATLALVKTGILEILIHECEQQWDKLPKERANERRLKLEELCRHLHDQASKSSSMLAEQLDEKTRMSLQSVQCTLRDKEEMRLQRVQHQQDRYKLHVKRMEVKLKTAIQKKVEAEEEAEHKRRVAERQAYLDSMMNVHKQIKESSKKICLQLEKDKQKDFLHPDAVKIKENVDQLSQQADRLLADAKLKGASMDLVENMHKIIESLMIHQERASRIIAEADRLSQEDAARKVREAQQQAAAAVAITHTPKSELSPLAQTSLKTSQNSVLQKAISADALEEYEGIRNKHKAVMDSYGKLAQTSDPQLKKYRFDLQKAVNVPVNAISNQCGSHLMDKLQRLRSLLLGEMVNVSGRRVSASQNTEGQPFVKDLLAKKIVKQSDEQVSSNYESAFPFAAIAVTLWCEFPDVGELMLAHFYLKCPFLVPYHITKSQDQSNEDYYKSLGYNYESDGVVEKQDKYLRRMSGFMRLYAAIMITQPMPGTKKVHPYGIDHAWKWLARLLNVEPQPDITATMLFDFLEVCGNALTAAYSRQFFKLIRVLYKNYFPKIVAVTPKGSGGPVVRLQTFLERVIKEQQIQPPKGKLQADFWRT
ncbi:nucleoporin GLE1-like [Acanthaster planci]|uniref:mRNA export factor GLE1 n=1 Tax=Acanthaster planci TaxID=133434 RepID=A0A8B7ZKC3_ACAPL|nr:nucleoporin GLE1-like [Acanthaster planci]XP_022106073.1 nucleoporin GLE1-like [Acanthaster planci]